MAPTHDVCTMGVACKLPTVAISGSLHNAQLGVCTLHRKSRIVGVVEAVHKSVDEHCEKRLSLIQKAKERHAYDTKCKACVILRVTVLPCMCMYGSGCV